MNKIILVLGEILLRNGENYSKLTVSIVLPVYNGEEYIGRCVENILCQSYTNFELIIVNDGSTDQTASLLSQYKDRRIKVFHNVVNKGIAESLNLGIKNSSGEYIFRMDVDDLMHKKRIEIQLEFMVKFNLDWCACGSQELNPDNSHYNDLAIEPVCNPKKMLVVSGLCIKNIFAHGGIAYRKDFMMKNSLEYASVKAEDLRLWVDFFKSRADMGLLDLPIYMHYRNQDGLYSKNKATIDSEAKSYHCEAIRHFFSEFRVELKSWQFLRSFFKNIFALDGFKGYFKLVYYAIICK